MRAPVTVHAALIAGALSLCATAGVGGQSPQKDPGPAPMGMQSQVDRKLDWAWGELVYGRTYNTVLTITNKCRVPQPVTIFIYDPYFEVDKPTFKDFEIVMKDGKPVMEKELVWRHSPGDDQPARSPVADARMPLSARAMLSIPDAGCTAAPFGRGSEAPGQCQITAPPGLTPLAVTITTPSLPDLVLPPGFDTTMLYDEIAGELVIYSPFGDKCVPSRDEYVASGHVHLYATEPDPPDAGGARCRDWWDREQRPQGLADDCTDEIRELALGYRRSVLEAHIEKHPAAWSWVPSEDAIRGMTADALIAMKSRARRAM